MRSKVSSRGVLGFVVGVVLALGCLAPAAQAYRPRCRPGPGTSTIARSSRARIFADFASGNDYACLYSTGHAYYLSSTEHYDYLLVHFAGPYVGFVENIAANDDHIGVMNLLTGRQRSYREVTPIRQTGSSCGSSTPVCYVVCPHVDSLVLKADGAVAWIATNFAGEGCINPPGPVTEVRRHDRRGLTVVASDTHIAPTSLRLSGSTLRWTDAGHHRSARLY